MLKLFVFAASIIIFIISITLSIFSDALKSNFNSSKFDLSDIQSNWNKDVIMNIEFSDSPCISSEVFISNGFEGTVNGCDCSNITSFGIYSFLGIENSKDIFRRRCSANDTIVGCQNIPEISSSPFRKLGNQHLCIKRGILNFYNYSKLAFNSTEECPFNFKNCGIIDTNNNKLCLPNNYECPINELLYIRNKKDLKEYSGKNYKIHHFGKDIETDYLVFTNENTLGRIIVDLEMTENPNGICIDRQNESKYKGYPLDKKFIKNPNKVYSDKYICTEFTLKTNNSQYGSIFQYDTRFNHVTEFEKLDIFNNNKLTNFIKSSNPKYPDAEFVGKLNLMSRPYISWNLNCVYDDDYNLYFLTNISNKMEYVQKISTFFVLFGRLQLLFGFIACITTCCTKAENITGIILQFLFSGMCFIFVVVSFILINIFYEILKQNNDILLNKCGDEITSLFFKNFNERLSMVYIHIILIISLIGTFLFPFIYMVNFYEKPVNNHNHI